MLLGLDSVLSGTPHHVAVVPWVGSLGCRRITSRPGDRRSHLRCGPLRGPRRGNALKRFSLLIAVIATFAITSAALAAPPLQEFGTGDVTITGTSATIVNEAGEYGGVYLPNARRLSGSLLADVDFSFTSTGDVGGGAPRFSIPIDTDGDLKTTEDYAFIDVNGCGGDTFVSTTNVNCVVYFGSDVYANWDAFAAAHPTYRISRAIPFIIADVEGSYEVEDVDLQ